MRKVGRTHSWALAVTGLMAWMLAGCGTHDRSDGSIDGAVLFDVSFDFGEAHSTCQDNDHDQFGVDCRLGPDCDDSNAAITDQCYRCSQPATGCSCTEEGERRACDAITDSTVPGPDGTWSRCISPFGFTCSAMIGAAWRARDVRQMPAAL